MKGIGPDEAAELMSELGLEFKVTPIPFEAQPAAAELDAVVQAALREGYKFVRFEGKLKEYDVTAFAVLSRSGERALKNT